MPNDPMLEELKELAQWFRVRGMMDNASFLESVVSRLKQSPAQILGAKGGSKSRRKITPEQQAKMQAARTAPKRDKERK